MLYISDRSFKIEVVITEQQSTHLYMHNECMIKPCWAKLDKGI